MGRFKRVHVKKRKFLQIIFLTIVSTCLIFIAVPHQQVHAFSPQIIQKGAIGEDVIELQARLQYIGFYNGKIDGVFGWGTYWALRNFQSEFGMEIDGLGGQKTKEKLAQVTKYDQEGIQNETNAGGEGNKEENVATEPTSTNVPQGYSQNDIQLLANAVYGEARGESYEGQVAVAAVILNRVQSATFPNTVAGVVFEPRAFTAVADGQIYLTPNETAKEAVLDAINGWDPSGNALYYFNPETATSSWIWSRPQIKQIGKHIFCK